MWVSEPTDNPDLFLNNWYAFYREGLPFDNLQQQSIWEYVKNFVQEHGHVPKLTTIQDHFEGQNELEVVDQLEILSGLKPLVKGDFAVTLQDRAEEHRQKRVESILQEANKINWEGIDYQEGRKTIRRKGSRDALSFVVNEAPDILTPVLNSRLRGEVLRDMENFVREYDQTRDDPNQGIGHYTGLQQMDEPLGGAKRFELWTHAAFAGHMKTTICLNWAYNQAVYMGQNVYYYSLEMPYEQIRRIMVAMHSMHEIFNEDRMSYGLQATPDNPTSLDYQFIRYGKLTPNQEAFLKECVIEDLKDPDNNYGAFYVDTPDPNKDKTTLPDIRTAAEMQHCQTPFKIMFIDHLLLVSSRKWIPNATDRLNEIVRDAKWMALHFNRGEGIAVVALWQTNREGFKFALKNDGRYRLVDLAQANEIERSSDVVTYSWIDDNLRKQNRVQIGCLKSREVGPFERFAARVEWPCRRVLTCFDPGEVDPEDNHPSTDDEIENVMDTE